MKFKNKIYIIIINFISNYVIINKLKLTGQDFRPRRKHASRTRANFCSGD